MTGLLETRLFGVCRDCIPHAHEAEALTESNQSEFPYCSICENFVNSVEGVEFDVVHISTEPCDCEPDRPQHNSGGNYHYSRYEVKAVGRFYNDEINEPSYSYRPLPLIRFSNRSGGLVVNEAGIEIVSEGKNYTYESGQGQTVYRGFALVRCRFVCKDDEGRPVFIDDQDREFAYLVTGGTPADIQRCSFVEPIYS